MEIVLLKLLEVVLPYANLMELISLSLNANSAVQLLNGSVGEILISVKNVTKNSAMEIM